MTVSYPADSLPPVNDYDDMMRMIRDVPTASACLINMPGASKKDQLFGFYSASETLKGGFGPVFFSQVERHGLDALLRHRRVGQLRDQEPGALRLGGQSGSAPGER